MALKRNGRLWANEGGDSDTLEKLQPCFSKHFPLFYYFNSKYHQLLWVQWQRTLLNSRISFPMVIKKAGRATGIVLFTTRGLEPVLPLMFVEVKMNSLFPPGMWGHTVNKVDQSPSRSDNNLPWFSSEAFPFLFIWFIRWSTCWSQHC